MLSDHERDQLKAQHKQERDGRVRDRIKAVLLHDKGWSPQQIAEALFISSQAVRNHLDEYDASRKLKPTSGGSEEKLSKEQTEKLEACLQEHIYLYVKDIIAYVQSVWSVTYSVPGMRNWLQRRCNDMASSTKSLLLCRARPMNSNNDSGWLNTEN